jgi:hypothetical protein
MFSSSHCAMAFSSERFACSAVVAPPKPPASATVSSDFYAAISKFSNAKFANKFFKISSPATVWAIAAIDPVNDNAMSFSEERSSSRLSRTSSMKTI